MHGALLCGLSLGDGPSLHFLMRVAVGLQSELALRAAGPRC